MSRRGAREAIAQRWEGAWGGVRSAFERFRESRLYVQTVCTAVLVGAGWLIHLLPYGPLARVDAALREMVSRDYDFVGRWHVARDWAGERGGWIAAAGGLWNDGRGLLQDWIGIPPLGEVATAAQEADQRSPGQTVTPSDPFATNLGGMDDGLGTEKVQVGLSGAPAAPVLPVDGAVHWGYGWLPQEVGEEFHEGIDFLTSAGSAVSAVQEGTVVSVRADPGLGGLIEIRHGDLIAVYAQVEAIRVSAGESVSRGQVIAAVARPKGSEGSQPPHLHFEIRPVATGEPVDPAAYLGLGGRRL